MRKAVTILFLCLLSHFCSAVNYLSNRLKQIADSGGISIPDYRGNEMEKCSFFQNGIFYPVVVEYDTDAVIHIGLDIFGPQIKEFNPMVYNFIERYLLELITIYSPSEAKNIMRADGVTIKGNLEELFQINTNNLKITYTTANGSSGAVLIRTNEGSQLLDIVFPLSISLISGMDKPELDASFISGLSSYNVLVKNIVPDNLSRIDNNLYVSENGYYETPDVQNCSFYRKRILSYEPICNSSLPKESIMTLLTAHARSNQFTVHLTQYEYNYSKVKLDVSLDQVLGYCLNSGCTPYVGIEQCDDTKIVASLFMVNEDLGYCHTFKFVMSPSILGKGNGNIDASVYTFTPIHNISK